MDDTANVTVAGAGTTSCIKSQPDINFSEPFRRNNTHEKRRMFVYIYSCIFARFRSEFTV